MLVVVLVRVFEIVELVCVRNTSPVTFGLEIADHSKVAGTEEVKLCEKLVALHIDWSKIVPTRGVGRTVISKGNVVPGHVTPAEIY